jgi:hypothetical protein
MTNKGHGIKKLLTKEMFKERKREREKERKREREKERKREREKERKRERADKLLHFAILNKKLSKVHPHVMTKLFLQQLEEEGVEINDPFKIVLLSFLF